ncbi:MAG TPA: DUF1697 domain-containing protein [Gemmatimonadaceae bacterium]|nr:DUF1697 domain-containing protein [Gemmatimonadaceae bacterium]
MALIVLLRGVNVGGHRTFRPSRLAQQLREFDVVNVGAAGTFVVRRPGPRPQFRAALLRKLPFQTEIVFCEGRRLLDLDSAEPFAGRAADPSVVRFASFLVRRPGEPLKLPLHLPDASDWLVRVHGCDGLIAYGEYRRHMKTIGYLGRLDKAFGVPVTTRSWNTVNSVLKVLS